MLVVNDLVKQFKKKRQGISLFSRTATVVDHLNFYVPQRSCFGLLGTLLLNEQSSSTRIVIFFLFQVRMELEKQQLFEF